MFGNVGFRRHGRILHGLRHVCSYQRHNGRRMLQLLRQPSSSRFILKPLMRTYSRSLESAVPSACGFHDYDHEKKTVRLVQPEYFNFATDVVDQWAAVEKSSDLRQGMPAFWWIDDNGNELKWNFQDISEKSKRVANLLTGPCGLKRGDRMIVIMSRLPQWWLINVAAIRSSIVLIPGTSQLTSRDVKERLDRSGAKAVIVDEGSADMVDEIIDDCPQVSTKLLVTNRSGTKRLGWLNFEDLFNDVGAEFLSAKTRSDESMMIYFTSGTTGYPKMAEHTHASYGLGHAITGRYMLDSTPTDVIWNMSDTGWAKSAYSNLFGPWYQGACVFIHHTSRFDPEKTLRLLEQYPVTTFCNAPTAYRMMVHENLKNYRFKALRHCLSAGEPLNPEVIEAWFDGVGQGVREGYGQTEMVLACATYRCIPLKLGSMGKAAPGMDLRVIDDNAQPLGPGVEGDIALKIKPDRPVGLFKQYLGDPERMAASIHGDYFMTGDRGKIDQDGYFWFIGRSDDVIMSAGYRIGPFEVESALIEHPAVTESAVVSSPDELRGEVVKAFVVLTNKFKGADQEWLTKDIQDHVKRITAPYKYPRKVEFVETLPKTVSGKIRRIELRNKEWGKKK